MKIRDGQAKMRQPEAREDQGPGQEQFELFLTNHGRAFEAVPIGLSRRPDYLVKIGDQPLLFEVKALTADDNFGTLSTRTVGDHIRSKISEAKDQIQFGAKHGIPSVLIVYNVLDPMHLFGTEPHDFRAAMHGAWTVVISAEPREIIASGYGRNRAFREGHNTSFSALGHLAPGRKGEMTVQLFPNMHAKVLLPPLPPCFEIDSNV